jgi:hypothetical protein
MRKAGPFPKTRTYTSRSLNAVFVLPFGEEMQYSDQHETLSVS